MYELLEEGGFFYVWVTNWWQSVNTSNLFGHFPFAPQRMTRDEFFDYAKKTMPDHADDIIKAYGYFDPTQPTLSNYMEVAHNAGFIPINWKENVHPEIIRSAGALTTLGLGELDPAELDRALVDIQRHRPDVRLQDLFAFSHSMLFYKPPKSNGINRQVLDAQAAGAEFHYRPTSAFGKTLKAVAEKIFMP